MKTFLPYTTTLPLEAATELLAVARGTSTLSLNEKVNAGYAVESYALGCALPLTPDRPQATATATAPTTIPTATPTAKTKAGMSRSELADTLQLLLTTHESYRSGLNINWLQVAAAVAQLLQAILSSGS